jgi:lysophospholipase L1-like esterase
MAPETPSSGSRAVAVAFLAGALTVAVIATAFVLFLVYRIGFETIWERTGVAFGGMVIDMPRELIDEIAALNGAIGNAGNPTNATEHDTILVRPDDALGWVLRPNVAVDGFQIAGLDAWNLDPPVIFTPANAKLSPELRSYLDDHTVVASRYTTDANGFRLTLPVVESDRRILVVGDSGVFGLGVGDAETIPSQLQRLVGDGIEVVNAGVSGYDGRQVLAAATKHAAEGHYELLVYIAHNNDFYEPRHMSNPDKLREVMAGFERLATEFDHGIVVGLVMALEYTARDTLRGEGWNSRRIAALEQLRVDLAEWTAAAGIPFVDWSDLAAEKRLQEKAFFSQWSWYADHAHLAPRGTRLLAERLYAKFPPTLQGSEAPLRGLAPEATPDRESSTP